MRPWLAVMVVLGKGLALAAWMGGFAPVAARWALFFAPDVLILYAHFVPAAQGLGPVKSRFATERKEVWLTVDDGPDPEDTPRLLALLAQHQARATFFLIGERAARWPELVQRIVAAGHDVGHHTQTHPLTDFWCARPRRVARELDTALAVYQAVAGVRPRWFRAPAGIKNVFLATALRRRKLTAVAWSVRSLDSICREPQPAVSRVVRGLEPGAIILMHEGPRLSAAVRVQAIRAVLTALTERGYRCVLPPAESLR